MGQFVGIPRALLARVTLLIQVRELQPRDAAVLMAVTHYLSPVDGRMTATAETIAERLNMQRPHVTSSLQRLIAAGCLEKHYDGRTGDRHLSIPGAITGVEEDPWGE
jgi:predicted transcriptional regulator